MGSKDELRTIRIRLRILEEPNELAYEERVQARVELIDDEQAPVVQTTRPYDDV